MYTKSIEEYATDVFEMHERATCRFSHQDIREKHIDIVKYNVTKLVEALSQLEDDTTALKDYYIKRAVWIGKKYGNEYCKVLSERIAEISMEQRKKEREEMQRREDLELLEDILSEKAEDLCEEDIEDMYKIVEKQKDYLTKEQKERFYDVHLTLAEIAEDEETAFANKLYNQMIEEIVIEDVVLTGSLYIPCNRCSGKGIIDQYHYICFGRCFKCDGKGRL